MLTAIYVRWIVTIIFCYLHLQWSQIWRVYAFSVKFFINSLLLFKKMITEAQTQVIYMLGLQWAGESKSSAELLILNSRTSKVSNYSGYSVWCLQPWVPQNSCQEMSELRWLISKRTQFFKLPISSVRNIIRKCKINGTVEVKARSGRKFSDRMTRGPGEKPHITTV